MPSSSFAFSSSVSGIDAMGNWWEKPCIFQWVGDTIGMESDGKKVPIVWGKYGCQFPRLSQFNVFRCIIQCYGKLMEKPKHLPCDEVYYRMRIWLEKCTHTIGKVWVPISQAFPRVLLHFPVLWEIDGKTHAFLICWSIPQDGNLMEKSTHAIEKVWELISHALPIWWFLLNFPVLLEIDY